MMVKEIGSDFPIKLHLFSKKRRNIPKNSILLASGRDSITYILKSMKKNSNFLLPSYLCESVLDPFKKLDIKYSFYKIDKSLEIDLKDLKRKIKTKKPSSILIINYFGFIQPEIKKIKEICRKNKILLIEDQVQSFLTKNKNYGDFIFNSYRKFLPIPDGSFLMGKFDRKIKISPNKTKYSSIRLRAGIAKNLNISKEYYHNKFKKAEDFIDKHYWPSKMSSISKSILNKINIREIILKRRKNYSFLINNLNIKNIKTLYPKLPDNVCPLGFPIVSKNRKKIKSILIKNKIYPPIHWMLPKEISKKEFKDSWTLSESILTIPIDQRYNLKDMERIVKILNKDVSI